MFGPGAEMMSWSRPPSMAEGAVTLCTLQAYCLMMPEISNLVFAQSLEQTLALISSS